jgi:hypothetical protein
MPGPSKADRRMLMAAAYRLRFFTVRELAANARVLESSARDFIESVPYFEARDVADAGMTARSAAWRVPDWDYRVRPEHVRDLLAASGRRAAVTGNPGSGTSSMTIAPLLDLVANALSALETGRIEPERRDDELQIVRLQFRVALLQYKEEKKNQMRKKEKI